MSAIGGIVVAVCSLYRCFPSGINVGTHLKANYLHTFDVSLGYPPQSVNVALDLSSSDFWVFGTLNGTVGAKIKSGIFDTSATEQIYIPEVPIRQNSYYNQWAYEDNFDVHVEQVRTSLRIGGISLGIPYIGINKNHSLLTGHIVQSSGLFGIQRNMYANTITMNANYDSILTLYTPRIPKTKGRLVTGNISLPECKSNFVYYSLAGSNTNLTTYFSFVSPKQGNKKMTISTTTSFISVDSATYKSLEKAVGPIWDRIKKPEKNKPGRRHKLIECKNRGKAPTIEIGDPNVGLLKIPGKDYIRRTASGYCIFKVREQHSNDQHWILGYPFLKNYCLQIDLYKQKIGFAATNNS